MPLSLVVLSGAVATGKTTLAEDLVARYDASRIGSHELLVARLPAGVPRDRVSLQAFGEQLDQKTGGRWLADDVAVTTSRLPEDAIVVVDSARILGQIEAMRRAFGRRVTHVHLYAPVDELRRRYGRRRGRDLPSYDEVRRNPTEAAIDSLIEEADVVIDTSRSTAADVTVRAASHLGLTGRDTGRLVDVIVGGQYGSEGKGHVAYQISPAYDYLLRVGGPNAGHKVVWDSGRVYTHNQLPSGSRATEAHLLIGPGATIDVRRLTNEIADCGVEVDRLTIDGNAMIIENKDIAKEKGLVGAIGSTGKGGGAAASRRILRGKDVRLARDVRELIPYVGDVAGILEGAYSRGERILLEGTQGTGLSLFQGFFPYVTSRDTTVSGCLAEAGIAPTRVRRVVMVCRTYPIRVGSPPKSTSGPMGQALSWAEIARRSGLDVGELRKTERGSISGTRRRVAEFDWVQLRRASVLNNPTDIALTFADYISAENRRARRFEQLTEETIHFIEEV
ncbi:MAG: adenylosuccinate synthase, partial [Gaiellaceae bacterium]|nr:adenylosuccinate synthase [Gaiellaceae bacterium]